MALGMSGIVAFGNSIALGNMFFNHLPSLMRFAVHRCPGCIDVSLVILDRMGLDSAAERRANVGLPSIVLATSVFCEQSRPAVRS